LVGEPERKRLLGRHKRKWDDNIKSNSLKKQDGKERMRFFWLRVQCSGGL
jgi:hypothetical protein